LGDFGNCTSCGGFQAAASSGYYLGSEGLPRLEYFLPPSENLLLPQSSLTSFLKWSSPLVGAGVAIPGRSWSNCFSVIAFRVLCANL
jgi:hypothetical protein